LSTISGNGAINSGRPIAQASFIHTFDDPGSYTVASVGAPGCAGNISVVEPGLWLSVLLSFTRMITTKWEKNVRLQYIRTL